MQSVYRISGGAGLALTTAHYYTPSGRLIQRPWDATFDEYLSYTLRDQDAEQAAQPERPEAHRRGPSGLQRRRHRAGQARRDGPIEGFNPTRFGRMLYARQRVRELRAEVHRRRRHAHHAGVGTDRKLVKPQLRRRRRDGGRLPEQLKSDQAARSTRTASRRTCEFIKAMIRFEIDEAVFGIADARRHLIEVDPQAQVALTMFGEAQKLTELSTRARRGAKCARGSTQCRLGANDHNELWLAVCACPYS